MMTTLLASASTHCRPDPRVCLRSALAALVALAGGRAVAAERQEGGQNQPIEARFAVPEEAYCLGEPIILEFVVRNASDEDFHFGIANAPVWGFRFKPIGPTPGRVRPSELYRPMTDGCADHHTARAGTTLRKRIVLSRYLSFGAPGTYRLQCAIDAPIIRPRDEAPDGERREYLSVSQQVEIVIREFDREKVAAAAERLVARLGHPQATARREAVEELACVDPGIARPCLEGALTHPDRTVRRAAVDALAHVAGKEAIPLLVRALPTECPTVRWRIAVALGQIGAGDPRAIEALYPLLNDQYDKARWCAILAVGSIGDAKSIARLEPLLNDPEPRVRRHAQQCIELVRRRHPK